MPQVSQQIISSIKLTILIGKSEPIHLSGCSMSLKFSVLGCAGRVDRVREREPPITSLMHIDSGPSPTRRVGPSPRHGMHVTSRVSPRMKHRIASWMRRRCQCNLKTWRWSLFRRSGSDATRSPTLHRLVSRGSGTDTSHRPQAQMSVLVGGQ